MFKMAKYKNKEVVFIKLTKDELEKFHDSFNQESGIYLCYCLGNNKGYVGQTQNLLKRKENQHLQLLRTNRHKNQYLQNSFNKYGEDSFVWKVIEYCPVEQLDDREIYWIKELNTKLPNGFNKTNGGNGTRGFEPSEETCRKMSESWSEERKYDNSKRTKELWESEEYRANMRQKFVDAWTEERREKISSDMRKRFASMTEDERLAFSKKISESHPDMSGVKNPRARAIMCIETGEVFGTIKHAAQHYNINYSTLKKHTQGHLEHAKGYHFKLLNKTSFRQA